MHVPDVRLFIFNPYVLAGGDSRGPETCRHAHAESLPVPVSEPSLHEHVGTARGSHAVVLWHRAALR